MNLLVYRLETNFCRELGAWFAFRARTTAQLGADLVGRQLIATVGFHQAGSQVQLHLCFLVSCFFADVYELSIQQGHLDML